MDDVEDYWERGDGLVLPPTDAPYLNLGVYGADVLDVMLLNADIVADGWQAGQDDALLAQLVRRQRLRVADRARGAVEHPTDAPAGPHPAAWGARVSPAGGDGPGIETLVVTRRQQCPRVRRPPRRALDTSGLSRCIAASTSRYQGRLQRVAARSLRGQERSSWSSWKDRRRHHPGHRPAGDDRTDRQRVAMVSAGRGTSRTTCGPGSTTVTSIRIATHLHRRGRPGRGLGDRRLQRDDHRHRAAGPPGRATGTSWTWRRCSTALPRSATSRTQRPARRGGSRTSCRRSWRRPAGAEHPVPRVGSNRTDRGRVVLARRRAPDNDRVRDHRPRERADANRHAGAVFKTPSGVRPPGSVDVDFARGVTRRTA